jgi:putative ABC transport system permease protein
VSRRVPALARRTVRLASRCVPGYRRAQWLRQWEADLEFWCSRGRGRTGAFRFALGSFSHALFLRREAMTVRGWGADVRQSARALAKTPGFTALTVGTLAIGIGTAAGVFSIVETLVLRPLAFAEDERLVRIYSTNPERGSGRFSVSYPDFRDFSARADLFESASFYMGGVRDLSGEGEPERVSVTAVHDGFFGVLRSEFLRGRPFAEDDHAVSAPPTVILSESFWARRFGSDSTVVGRPIRLDGVEHVVLGVLRAGQGWPGDGQTWVPLQWGQGVPEYADARSNHTWQVLGRMTDGVEVSLASDQIVSMARTLYSDASVDSRDEGTEAVVIPLRASEAGSETAAIFSVMAVAVFLVLLVACLNASGLLLTRSWGRARELSLRAALGAGRARLAIILFGESLILALLGGALGVSLAVFGLRQVVRSLPIGGLDLTGISLNGPVVASALLMSVVAALLAGIVPALRASRVSVAEALKEGGSNASEGLSRSRLRRALVVAQLALSLSLLVSAGMTVRGFQRQISTDPGFDQSNLLTFTVRLPGARYTEAALVDAYYREAVDALEARPGILAASSTSRLPLGAGGFGLFRSFMFDGATPPPEGVEYPGAWVEVDESYFRTLGIEPLEGRSFADTDDRTAPLVAIVNRRMARLMSPDESIVGRSIRSYWDENLPRTVVGVVDDLQFDGLVRDESEALVLVPRAQAVRTAMAFLVRTEGDPGSRVAEIRDVLGALDPDVALDAMQTLGDAHASDLAGVRFLTTLFATFGVGALLLAISGVYGLISYSVSQRTQEIGIRMALGASSGTVRTGVLAEGAMLAGAGLAIGAVLAYGFSRLLAAALFGLADIDPATFVAVALALAASAVAASWFPAVRATRVDPMAALRRD